MEQPIEQPAKKKIYAAPKLVRYGDLVEVTRATGTTSQKNDSAHGNAKTS
jgi:hypothetical protein